MLRKKSNGKPLVAFAALALFLVLFTWRQSLHLDSIKGQRFAAKPLPTESVKRKDDSIVSVAEAVVRPSNVDLEKTFDLTSSVARNQFPTIADFLQRANGTYNGVRFETVRQKPRAMLLYDMLSREDCEQIILEANKTLARSEVVHEPGTSGVNSVRTSNGMFISRTFDANEKLRRKAAMLVGVPVENIEGTQVLKYEPGQFYRTHPDYFGHHPAGEREILRGGQRFATVLTWLNEIRGGGETRFPYAEPPLTVAQTGVGNSVMFYSLDASGHEEVGAQHEAVPPVEGAQKWVAVLWIRPHRFY